MTPSANRTRPRGGGTPVLFAHTVTRRTLPAQTPVLFAPTVTPGAARAQTPVLFAPTVTPGAARAETPVLFAHTVTRRTDPVPSGAPPPHIRKTPKRVSPIGAWRATSIPIARTRRVSSGSMIPSSQRRAVA